MPNVRVPAPPMAFWELKFHQVAIYTANILAATEQWISMGYEDWVYDSATLVGTEHGASHSKIGHMAFCYDAIPCELEYVNYSTPTRHNNDGRNGDPPFLSHMSTYVSDIRDEVSRLDMVYGARPYHRFHTEDHHNKNLPEGTYFEEAIYDTSKVLGFDLKLIQKVTA